MSKLVYYYINMASMIFSAFGADILALIYICIQSDRSIPAVAVARLGILHILVGSSTSSRVIIAVHCTGRPLSCEDNIYNNGSGHLVQ